jgi:hypothetical protein
MRQLLELARENVALKRELTSVGEKVQAVHRLLVGIPVTRKEYTMPRIIQLAPDGGGRYIAVDRDGEVWRGETMRQKWSPPSTPARARIRTLLTRRSP